MLDEFHDSLLHEAVDFLQQNFPSSADSTPCSTPSYVSKLTQIQPTIHWPTYFQEDINQALRNIWAPTTLKTYATGVNAYLNFCRLHKIPSSLVYPASEPILCAFFSSRLHLAPSTLKNYLSGLKAWHTRDNKPFPDSRRLTLITRQQQNQSPKSKTKLPVLLEDVKILRQHLDISEPKDAATWACAVIAFFGLCRLGELLPSSSTFDSTRFPSVKQFHLSSKHARLTLPWTKVAKFQAQDVFITQQMPPLCPIAAWKNYCLVSLPKPDDPIFSYYTLGVRHVLTKRSFLDRCNELWQINIGKKLSGHSFRIGGTTTFLQSGVHPDYIKQHGRWNSDSFLRYWRNLESIIPVKVEFVEAGLVSGLPRAADRHGHGQASLLGRRDDPRKAPPPSSQPPGPLTARGPPTTGGQNKRGGPVE